MDDKQQLNLFNEIIEECSCEPLTGFFRTGCCDTSDQDLGSHTVCALMTEDFLRFSMSQGNDLSTPVPQYNFPGLKEGDRWCLCANRWLEAYEANSAPKIVAKATNIKALEIIPMEIIKGFAIDLV
ncbi:MAG: DUF2237 domain-containing protein [Gammaproteobacteria bacterium]